MTVYMAPICWLWYQHRAIATVRPSVEQFVTKGGVDQHCMMRSTLIPFPSISHWGDPTKQGALMSCKNYLGGLISSSVYHTPWISTTC